MREPQLRKLALSLPDVMEGSWYGFPAFKVAGKGFARVRDKGTVLVLVLSFEDRDFLMQSDPETFFTTDHYRDYPSVLARLKGLTPGRARELLETARSFVASQTSVRRPKRRPRT